MVFEFRKAKPNDMLSVNILYRDVADYLQAQGIDQWDEQYPSQTILQKDICKRQMFLLCQDESILAAVVINEEQEEEYLTGDWKDKGRFAVIHRLCVSPKHQNIGLGSKVMELAESFVKDAGYTSIRLDVFSQNENACKLYNNFGYTYAGEVTFCKGQFFLMEKVF